MKNLAFILSHFCLVLPGLALNHNASAGDVVVVVSAKSPVTTLNKSQLTNIFLGKTNRFPDGSPAIPFDQVEDSPRRTAFYANYLDRSPSQLKSHWAKIIFTGRGKPPKALSSDDTVKNQIANNLSAIGYIDENSLDDSLKVVARK